MDGLTKIAVQSYEQLWNDDQKKKFDNFFKELDCNGNKQVSFNELREKNIISDDLLYVLTELDTNNNRVLDFEEILCLYYYKYAMPDVLKSYTPSIRFCKGSICARLQKMPDFSCFLCLNKRFRRSYHLCSSCHEKGVHMKHEHPEYCVLNRPALDVLDKMKDLLFQEDKAKKEGPDYMKMGSEVALRAIPALVIAGASGACTIM